MFIKREVGFLCRGEHGNPHSVLGMHFIEDKTIIRAFMPEAKQAWIIKDPPSDDGIYEMQKVYRVGFFVYKSESKEIFRYKIRILTHWDEVREFYDPYFFKPSLITDFDLYLIGEGTHYKIFDKLGAHVVEMDGIKGVHFAVWAPNATRVSVIGDFNGWDGRRHPMSKRSTIGVWELFIPGLDEGALYKFEIKTIFSNYLEQKADPYAFKTELRPKTASIVYNLTDKYQWNDDSWLKKRAATNWFESPITIYEVHLGSWMRRSENENDVYNYREIADKLIPYIKELGYTHVELLPVSEHPLDASWGYQVTGYYAPTSRFGEPHDFMYFVDKCHQNDLGVIVDWVPAHFPKDGHGLRFFDGTALYEHEDPRKGEHKDWGTLIFNYGRNEVRNFLIANALFWLHYYHIDGLRVDAVASMLYLDYSKQEGEWIPNKYGGRENLEAIEFIKQFNEVVHREFHGILTIAEESTSWPSVCKPTYLGGLGFSMKWNMGWMHDTLDYFTKDPIFRKYHTYDLTFSLIYAFTENFILSFSHDEVVYGKKSLLNKMPGDLWQKFANLRALYGYMYGHPGKKLLFMGGEFGQWDEWCFFRSLDWHLLEYEHHKKLLKYVQDLNNIYRSEPAMYEVDFKPKGFEWIDFHDHDNSIVSFIRKAKNPHDFLVFVFNFTPIPREDYVIGVPYDGFYKELLNSDSEIYFGSNLGNAGGVFAEYRHSHGRPFSIKVLLPPLSMLIFKKV
ncbi:MAG: 1,4-alpha-glucan branching protein GlgB [Thermodesulfovibrionales bacterium]|nr:1,4-alpha-glucan branching protein GlgB [Thermodesulfovibrionales bacterium]